MGSRPPSEPCCRTRGTAAAPGTAQVAGAASGASVSEAHYGQQRWDAFEPRGVRARIASATRGAPLYAEVAPMAVSRSMSSREEKTRGMSLARTSMRTPMTDGKMRAVDGESLSAQSIARHATCSAVNLKLIGGTCKK